MSLFWLPLRSLCCEIQLGAATDKQNYGPRKAGRNTGQHVVEMPLPWVKYWSLLHRTEFTRPAGIK